MSPTRCARAVEWHENGRWECRNCGNLLATDADGDLERPARHRGQNRRPLAPAPADAAAFGRAVDLAETAANALPDVVSHEEIARAVVEALYQAGMLRRTPAKATSSA